MCKLVTLGGSCYWPSKANQWDSQRSLDISWRFVDPLAMTKISGINEGLPIEARQDIECMGIFP